MAVSDQQKLDFLLKKIGYTKTKTGSTVGTGAVSGTPKQPFAEAIASPLVVPNSSLWNEADSIPVTPPGSDTNQVKVYSTTSAIRMTADATSSGNRAYIAYSTYNDTSSARLTNWIDTQFGSLYLIKVFKNDPTVPANNLSAGATNENWFFDYSAGVLNFNDTTVPSHSDIYIVGYRYIGQTGAPSSGISTFSFLDLTVERNLDVGVQGGISTFRNNIDANGIIEGIAGENKIPFLYSNLAALPNAGTYHGMFAHVHSEGRGYFAHAGNWLELVNKDTSGNVGLSGDLDVDGHTNLDNVNISGVTTMTGMLQIDSGNLQIYGTAPNIFLRDTNDNPDFRVMNSHGSFKIFDETNGVDRFIINPNGKVSILYDLDVDGHTELDNVNVVGITTFNNNVQLLDNDKLQFGDSQDLEILHENALNASRVINHTGTLRFESNDYEFKDKDNGDMMMKLIHDGSVELYHDNEFKFKTTGSGINVSGTTTTTGLDVTGVSTFTGAIDANGDLDVSGISTFTGNIHAEANIGIGTNNPTAPLHISGPDAASAMIKIEDNNNNIAASQILVQNGGRDLRISAPNDIIFTKLTGSIPLLYLENGNAVGIGTDNPSATLDVFGNTKLRNDLDVDGHTELDNLRVSGISTFLNNIVVNANADINGNLFVQNKIETNGNLKVSGVSTFSDNVTVSGNSTFTGNIDLNADLDVDGHTNLDNVSIAGVTTTSGLLDINAGGQANTFKVEDLTSGRVVLAGTGGELEDSNKLTFDGTTLGLTGNANFTGNLTVGGVLTYEDVKNVDAVGLITARSGIRVTSGVIEAQAGENKIPSLYSAMGNLPSAGSYHGMFAHVHATGRGYFAHAGNWLELVNREINGVVGTGTETYNIGNLVSTSSTATSLNVTGVTTVSGQANLSGFTTTTSYGLTTRDLYTSGITTVHKAFRVDGQSTGTGLMPFVVRHGGYQGIQTSLFTSTLNNYPELVLENTWNGNWNTTGPWKLKWTLPNEQELGPVGDSRILSELQPTVNNSGVLSGFRLRTTDNSTGLKTVFLMNSNVTRFFTNGTDNFRIDQTGIGVTRYIYHYGDIPSDTNTRFGFSNNDTIDFDTNGTQRLRINNSSSTFSNNIVASADFDVDGHTNLDNVSIAGFTTITQDLDVDGKVLIGTTIEGHANADDLTIATSGDTGITIRSGTTHNGRIYFSDATSGAGEVVGSLDYDHNIDTFKIVTNGSERFRIDSSGRVLIGTDTEGHPNADDFTVATSGDTGITIRSGASHNGRIYFSDATSGTGEVVGSLDYDHNNNKFSIFTNNQARFHIDSSGNVGISNDLTVDGNLDVDSHTNLDNVSVAGVTTFSDTVKVGTGVTALTNGNVSIGGTLELFNTTGDANNNPSEIKLSKLTISQHNNTGTYKLNNSHFGGMILLSAGGGGFGGIQFWNSNFSRQYFTAEDQGSVKLFYNNTARFETSGVGATVYGNLDVTADLDVDGHTNLDNVSIAGFTTITQDLDVDGSIGVGIANPSQKIHIDGGNLLISNSTQSGSSAPQIRLNSSSSDGSATRFMFGLATGSNHFINGSTSNDSCFSAPSTMMFGIGNTRKFRIKTTDVLTDIDFIPSADDATSLGRSNARWSDLFTVDADISGNLNVTGIVTAKSIDLDGDLDVDGHTNLDNVSVAGVTTFAGNARFDSTITAGGSTGNNGQYLKSTGTGVAWENYPAARTATTYTATAGQTTFSFNYNVGYLDVFVNGVKLTASEFTATNGTSVIIAVSLFAGDTVDLVSYNTIVSGAGAFLANLIEDLTPELGGNLSLNNKNITGTGNVNVNGQVNATTFVGDGSGLTGVVGSGSGIIVKDSGATVGTAGTINFGAQLELSTISNASVTVGVTTNQFNVNNFDSTGISTFRDIDVDGHTELDNVNVSGVITATTFSGTLSGNASGLSGTPSLALLDLDVDGHTELDNVNVSGVITATTYKGAIQATSGTFSSDVDVDGDLVLPSSGKSIKIWTGGTQGIVINHGGTSGLGEIDCLTGMMRIKAGQIKLSNRFGNLDMLTCNSYGSVDLFHNNILRFTTTGYGVSTTGLEVVGVSTFSGNIDANANIDLAGDLDVDGHTNLDNVSIAGVVTAASFVGDGSGLTGVTASGVGIEIKDGGSIVGTAGTIDFGTGLDVSPASAGIVTITSSSSSTALKDSDGNVKIQAQASGAIHTGISTFTAAANALNVNCGTTNPAINIQYNGTTKGTLTPETNGLEIGVNGTNNIFMHLSQNGGSGGDFIVQKTGTEIFKISGTGEVEIANDLDVDGHTNLDNVSIAGVCTATTFSGDGSGLTGVAANVGITTNLTGTFSSSPGSPSTINSFGYGADDRVVEYTVLIEQGSNFQSQKVLAMRSGTTVHSTQFAVIFSNNLLVQCDATINSGNLILRATPETGVTGTISYRVKREVM